MSYFLVSVISVARLQNLLCELSADSHKSRRVPHRSGSVLQPAQFDARSVSEYQVNFLSWFTDPIALLVRAASHLTVMVPCR